jgi:hypothetical protein
LEKNRSIMKQAANVKETEEARSLGPCQICGWEMLLVDSIDQHHWQPKSRGGRGVNYLHRICHRKLHSLFTNKELEAEFATPEALRRHPKMQKFITWVRRQPPEMVLRHRKAKKDKSYPAIG